MPCNHMCKTPCKDTHTCSCGCEESRRLESLALQQAEAGVTGRWVVAETEERRNSVQRAAIAKYQAYANGGSKEHDEILDQLAESQLQRNQPMGADTRLLPDSDNPVNSVSPIETGCSLAKNEGTGANKQKPANQPEGSLLDYW
ncbi:hypothetical protein BJY01DRAFT_147051 [Aspergillus pseudoustus]|uniref:Uncharacterized protein n=1 Tax=Aspergillus pseudoustus TaxID=1810923 RepID=A0ABR4KAC3_9EURO